METRRADWATASDTLMYINGGLLALQRAVPAPQRPPHYAAPDALFAGIGIFLTELSV